MITIAQLLGAAAIGFIAGGIAMGLLALHLRRAERMARKRGTS